MFLKESPFQNCGNEQHEIKNGKYLGWVQLNFLYFLLKIISQENLNLQEHYFNGIE